MTPEPRDLTEHRVEAIARALDPAAFRTVTGTVAARKRARKWAARLLESDPANAELKQQSALLERAAEVLDQAHVALLGLCAGKPVLDADEVICAVIRSKAELRARAG